MNKNKDRFIVVRPTGGPILAGATTHNVMDASMKPPVQVKSGAAITLDGRKHIVGNVYDEYYAEQECRRLNMLADSNRASAARRLKQVIGKRMALFTFSIGWDRRTGGKQSILCLVPGGTGVLNVSASVSTILGWKWKDNSVDAGNATNLVHKLSYMIYGDEEKLRNVPV